MCKAYAGMLWPDKSACTPEPLSLITSWRLKVTVIMGQSVSVPVILAKCSRVSPASITVEHTSQQLSDTCVRAPHQMERRRQRVPLFYARCPVISFESDQSCAAWSTCRQDTRRLMNTETVARCGCKHWSLLLRNNFRTSVRIWKPDEARRISVDFSQAMFDLSSRN